MASRDTNTKTLVRYHFGGILTTGKNSKGKTGYGAGHRRKTSSFLYVAGRRNSRTVAPLQGAIWQPVRKLECTHPWTQHSHLQQDILERLLATSTKIYVQKYSLCAVSHIIHNKKQETFKYLMLGDVLKRNRSILLYSIPTVLPCHK